MAPTTCLQCLIATRNVSKGYSPVVFVDPSGGSADSISLAIGHRENNIVVMDALCEVKPPFSPESVVGEFSALLKIYRVSKITGDRYAGDWPRASAFASTALVTSQHKYRSHYQISAAICCP
jgi:hypothetical protein